MGIRRPPIRARRIAWRKKRLARFNLNLDQLSETERLIFGDNIAYFKEPKK